MSASTSATSTITRLAPELPKAKGFLNIVRHGSGAIAVYVVTYHRVGEPSLRSKPSLAEGPEALIALLERMGVEFGRVEVRGALRDVLRLGSANIPDLWLSDEEIIERDLIES
jgi:hypothetical protein